MPRRTAFTLIELLAAIAIIAALVTASLYFVGGYVQYAQQNADKQTLTVLNDALTRYKGEGGNVAALTAGAPVGNIIARLKTPVTWGGNGPSHQFLQSAVTYPARSLSVLGTGSQYRFTRYNTSTNEAGGVTYPDIVNNGIIGWWKFDEGSGTTSADSSHNGNTASLTAGAGWGTGILGNALSLNGSGNNYARVNQIAINDFTISLWVKISSSYTNGGTQWYSGQGLFNAEVGGTANDYGVTFLNNKIAFGVGNPDTTIMSSQLVNDGAWHHICAVRIKSSGTMRLYIDGGLQASTSVAGTSSLTAPPYSYIGSSNAGDGYYGIINGLIDDVRVYNRALSASEVAQLAGQ